MNKQDKEGKNSEEATTNKKELSKDCCPECGSSLVRQGRCGLCINCGWSGCEL